MNNLPFPRKRVFFTHNLSLCLFLRLVGAENIPPQAERSRKEGRKKRLSERRGNLSTMLSVSFFNVVKPSPATWATNLFVSLKLKGNEDYHPA